MDWFEQTLQLPQDRLFVEHNPPTGRYQRVFAKLTYILREAQYLGVRAGEPDADHRVDIAIWCRPGHGKGCGFYCCFHLDLDGKGNVHAATLFCAYDGKGKSICLKSSEAAAAHASRHDFKEELSDEP